MEQMWSIVNKLGDLVEGCMGFLSITLVIFYKFEIISKLKDNPLPHLKRKTNNSNKIRPTILMR